MRYLDPKNDLTFKKVFGQHPALCISLLNSMLPLPDGEFVEWIEYLPAELVPELPLGKSSIVDVRCRDNRGRQFIVEMQMFWTDSFQYRVLFNASKAFVKQLGRGHEYKLLQPVYSLNFVNQAYTAGTDFYHHYQIVNLADTDQQLKGLEFVFIELPKYTPVSVTERKMMSLWLSYLTEIHDGTNYVSEKLKANPEIVQALEIIQESAFTPDELEWYDKYWDIISTERSYLVDARLEGKMEGMVEGRIEGRIEGQLEGRMEAKMETARKLRERGFSDQEISEITGLSIQEIGLL
jgi:predicted transposase/invertase (TIGR01784 family)